jgi:drug/metabolite transporter (DMT)-like permease
VTTRLALVATLAMVFALCYSTIKAGLEFAPPLRFGALRTLGGAGTLLLYLGTSGHARLVPPRATWAGVVALAVLGTVIQYGAMFMSPGVTGAGISSVLGNTGPLFAVALAAPVLGEPVTWRKGLALALGTTGAAIVAFPVVTDPAAPGVLAGLFPLTAAAAAAGSAVTLKWLDVGDALLSVVAWQLLLGGAALLAISAVIEGGRPVVWSTPFMGYLVFLAVVGTAFGVTGWYWLVQREDVGRISILLMVLVPVLGLVLARLFFGESIRLVSAVGAAVALVGVCVAATTNERPEIASITPQSGTGLG